MTKNARTATASSATSRRPGVIRRRRAGPAGVSPGGVTIGRTGRRTRRMPIGRSVSSSSAPAGAAGGAGGLGWMRRMAPRAAAARARAAPGGWPGPGAAPAGLRRPPVALRSGRPVRGWRPGVAGLGARVGRRNGIGSAYGGSGGVVAGVSGGGAGAGRRAKEDSGPACDGGFPARRASRSRRARSRSAALRCAPALESSRRDLLM